MAQRPLNVGLVGGGKGAFIVHAHSRAIHADGTRRIVAGALHADPKVALREAAKWPYPIRGYRSYDEMIAANASLPPDEKLDYVVIVTPNHVHYDPAIKALRAGIPVFCEKPLTLTLTEAAALVRFQRKCGVPFAVAHTYLGHWTSRFARWVVRSGALGNVRWADSSYIQGWLATKLESTGQQQATWRVDPKLAGISGCGGDIATHALMQLRYVTGLEVASVSAFLETFVPGRALDDHFTAYCRLSNGARALVRASQICIGHKNDFGIEVCGTRGSLRWRQEDSEAISVSLLGQADRTYYRGAVPAVDEALGKIPAALLAEPTIPSGHAEGFHDAFARLHRDFEADVRTWQETGRVEVDPGAYATVEDGWLGMAFIDRAVRSSARKGAWIEVPTTL